MIQLGLFARTYARVRIGEHDPLLQRLGRSLRLEHGLLAGGVLVVAYTLIELALLGWLFDWSIAGATAWMFLAAGGLLAAVYNLFTCDWIAEKIA